MPAADAVPAALLQSRRAAPPAPLWRLHARRRAVRARRHRAADHRVLLWELITPYNLRREIHENNNIAVAIVVAAFILGMAIVIAASLILIK